jgi:AcrR family transcriptional regulator
LKPPRLPRERPGAVGGKRDDNRRRRIRQICDAALALFLKGGISSTTIDQIVNKAGVAKGSFYRYFKDKKELVETLFAPLATTMRNAMDDCLKALGAAKTPAELNAAYIKLALSLAEPITTAPDLLRLYLQESRAPAAGARSVVRHFADEVTQRAIDLSAAAIEHGLVRQTNPRLTALTVIGATERLMHGYLSDEDLGPKEAIPQMVINVILDGVRPKPA